MNKPFALKGNIAYSERCDTITTHENAYVVCENGISQGVFAQLPARYAGISVYDYGDRLIVPGLTDLHVHAPQYANRGMAMDLELLDWLNTYTFPEEEKFRDTAYAQRAYRLFAHDLKHSATTRAVLFGTVHVPATILLMDEMECTGLRTYVGKVNMDRNSPAGLLERAEQSAADTITWLGETAGRYRHTFPILTPRFIPSCSEPLLRRLQTIAQEYALPVQSHLSENPEEIEWVRELCPWAKHYGEVYEQFGMFGGQRRTIMAHCVWSSEEEIQHMKKNGVWIAHSPSSNFNLSSGIAPVRHYLQNGNRVGLATDISGGESLSIFKAMNDAILVSKLRWRYVDECAKPLTTAEAFYLGTLGGGAFFGKVGSLEAGYEFDAVVIDDSPLTHPQPLTVLQRLERVIHLSDLCPVCAKFVAGEQIRLSDGE